MLGTTVLRFRNMFNEFSCPLSFGSYFFVRGGAFFASCETIVFQPEDKDSCQFLWKLWFFSKGEPGRSVR